MYKFCQDYVKPKNGVKTKLCYVDIYSFIVNITIDNVYKGIAEDVETKLDTPDYQLNRPVPKGKNKKVNGLKKDE